MEEMLLILIVTAILGFVGSLQLGAVNTLVIQTTLQQNFRAGIWVALGGIVPEILYSLLALLSLDWIKQNLIQYLEIAIIPFLLLLGLWNLLYNPPPKTSFSTTEKAKKGNFWWGVLAGIFNPQLYPFWVVVLVWMNGFESLVVDNWQKSLAFILGAALGTLGVLWVFAHIASRFRSQISKWGTVHINRVVGSILCGLALLQLL